jgi:hypothetical protein
MSKRKSKPSTITVRLTREQSTAIRRLAQRELERWRGIPGTLITRALRSILRKLAAKDIK